MFYIIYDVMAKELEEEMPVTPEITEETPVSEVAEETPAQHELYAKLKEYDPEGEFADDKSVMDAANSKLGEYDTYKQETEALLQNISDAVDADPEYAQLTAYIAKGMTFREAVSRLIDPADLEAQEGDPDFDALEAAKQERTAKRDEHGKRIAEIENNSKETANKVNQFADDNNLDEEATYNLLASIESAFKDFERGLLSEEVMAKFLVAENHDKEVEKAVENAVIETRNEVIDIQKSKSESATDNIPSISGTSVAKESPALPKESEISQIVKRNAASRKF